MTDLKKIEKVQYRGLKYIYNHFSLSYQALRERANVSLLYTCRLRSLMIEMYKISEGIGPTYLQPLVNKRNSMYSTRRKHAFMLPKCLTSKYGFKSFKYDVVKLWNCISIDSSQITCLKDFKTSIST